MKRLFALLGSVLLTVSCVNLYDTLFSVYAEDTQKCGDNITWQFDEDTKTLTLTGTGRMNDYSDYQGLPWVDHLLRAEHLVIGDGITAIGSFAFNFLGNIREITLPDSVTEIGANAFFGLPVEKVQLSKNLQSIGVLALYGANLTEVQIPEGTKTIGESCFTNNPNLTKITVPDSVTYIGAQGLTRIRNGMRHSAKRAI
ncbi:MAG: leucine-rich repeat domain-containing protein, partial [Oscillospiraceae bacterium]|nr:leucine-rich repeat domain-containing protein [Oscillospiraceae bacterium]